ncbi:hypothetical protein ACIBXA_32210, partial [Micromonospora echinaurantiaca]
AVDPHRVRDHHDPTGQSGRVTETVTYRCSRPLSSHLLSDVEQVCDYLVVLCDSRIQVAGPVPELLASHHRIAGHPAAMAGIEVIWAEHDRVVVRGDASVRATHAEPVTLEELVLAYMSRAAGAGARLGANAAVTR